MQKIEKLDGLVNLEELWLGKNKITKLEVEYRPAILVAAGRLIMPM
jgi:hypothetical protein